MSITKRTDMLCNNWDIMKEIKTSEFYNCPEYYRFMSNDIFLALESGFLNGNKTVKVSDCDFSKMILLKEVNENTKLSHYGN